jgi:DNA-binding NarL/FixJ family response regulator
VWFSWSNKRVLPLSISSTGWARAHTLHFPTVNIANPSQPANAAPPIFMVDDDEMDRVLFSRLVQSAEISNPCRLFASGDQMIDALIDVLRGATPPLVCFVDVKMAGMSGLDVLRWIRFQRPLEETAVVMLSSSEAWSLVGEAMRLGAQCYAAKFPPPEQLRDIIRESEKFAAACGRTAFPVACNLLVAAAQPVH